MTSSLTSLTRSPVLVGFGVRVRAWDVAENLGSLPGLELSTEGEVMGMEVESSMRRRFVGDAGRWASSRLPAFSAPSMEARLRFSAFVEDASMAQEEGLAGQASTARWTSDSQAVTRSEFKSSAARAWRTIP